jgi:hypothetical protein
MKINHLSLSSLIYLAPYQAKRIAVSAFSVSTIRALQDKSPADALPLWSTMRTA